jgi:hypothetical protein
LSSVLDGFVQRNQTCWNNGYSSDRPRYQGGSWGQCDHCQTHHAYCPGSRQSAAFDHPPPCLPPSQRTRLDFWVRLGHSQPPVVSLGYARRKLCSEYKLQLQHRFILSAAADRNRVLFGEGSAVGPRRQLDGSIGNARVAIDPSELLPRGVLLISHWSPNPGATRSSDLPPRRRAQALQPTPATSNHRETQADSAAGPRLHARRRRLQVQLPQAHRRWDAPLPPNLQCRQLRAAALPIARRERRPPPPRRALQKDLLGAPTDPPGGGRQTHSPHPPRSKAIRQRRGGLEPKQPPPPCARHQNAHVAALTKPKVAGRRLSRRRRCSPPVRAVPCLWRPLRCNRHSERIGLCARRALDTRAPNTHDRCQSPRPPPIPTREQVKLPFRRGNSCLPCGGYYKVSGSTRIQSFGVVLITYLCVPAKAGALALALLPRQDGFRTSRSQATSPPGHEPSSVDLLENVPLWTPSNRGIVRADAGTRTPDPFITSEVPPVGSFSLENTIFAPQPRRAEERRHRIDTADLRAFIGRTGEEMI